VVRLLTDVVSKNGNLLLSVPLRGDGTFDEKEEKILNEIAAWMEINGEGLFGTRPWKVHGEGPSFANSRPLHGLGFNESDYRSSTSEDIRFVAKDNLLYAHVMAWPKEGNNSILVRSLAKESELYPREVKSVELLGYETPLTFTRTDEGLRVELPKEVRFNDISLVLKITPLG